MKVNGSLVFDASSESRIDNLRVEKVASLPTHAGTVDAGRLIYVTTNTTLYKGTASAWEALATGGNAFSQVEGDAIETSLGAGINGDGTFNAAGFTTTLAMSSPTSFTNAIQQIANYATANDTLFEMDDVTLSQAVPAGAKFLYTSGGSNWVDHTLVLADVSNVTTSVTELNQLAGAGALAADFTKLHAITTSAAQINNATSTTATTTELNYVSGVTSAIQTQLNGKQAINTGLGALSTLLDAAGVGIVVQTGVDTVANRSLIQPSAGLTISTATGAAADFTFSLANDLAGLEGLATTGYSVRTGDGTWTTRTIAGTAGNIVVTNGSGVSSDTSLDLAAVTDSGTGTFLKLTTDGYGRVTGTTAVVTADITALANSQYLRLDGTTTMTNVLNAGGFRITSVAAPTGDTDATTKAYVDALIAGLSWKDAVAAASTGNLTLSGTQTVDGVALTAGMRVLVKDQTAPAQNGIYVVAAGAWSRATNMDQAAEFDGAAVFVQGGTVNEGTGWTEQLTVTTLGTDPVSFSQFSGGVAYIWGTGLQNTGNTVNVILGSGIAENPSDAVGLDLFDVANSALILTTNGTSREAPSSNNGQLFLLLDAAGALAQTSTGLKIAADSVTNAMIVNDTFTLNTDGGDGTYAFPLGGTFEIKGTSAQGISSANTLGSVTLTMANASASQRGVATFNTADFAVSVGGDVTIKAAGVDNAQLANSTVTIAGTSGSDAVALGETLTFSSTVAGLVSSTVATNGVALDIRLADAANTGVASFDAGTLAVSGAGVVSLNASIDDLTNVSGADAAAAGALLTKSAGDWVPVSRVDLAGSIPLGDLQDVGSAAPTTSGQALIADGSAWQATKIYHTQAFTSSASWSVTHSLNQQFVTVSVMVDNGGGTFDVVIPQSITMTSATQCVVTFNTPVAGRVAVMGIA